MTPPDLNLATHTAYPARRAARETDVARPEAWSALLVPLAFPRGVPAPALPLATPLIGGLAVKKLALALAAVVALGLALQGVRGFLAPARSTPQEPVGVQANLERAPRAPEPARVEVANEPRTPLDVAGEREAPFEGELVVTLVWADDGAPAAELCAEVEVLDGAAPRPDRIHVRSDAEGRARFPALPAGRVRLYPPGGSSEVQEIVAGEVREARLELPTRAVVEGRVLAPDGGPVGGATIRAQRWDGSALLAHTVGFSKADGSFRVRGLGDGEWIGATAVGWRPSLAFDPTDLPVGPRGTREVELGLGAPGARLAGRVLDAEGAPLAGAQVLAGPRGGAHRSLPDGRAAIDPAPALLETGSDGAFEVLGDFEPGRQPVEVIARGHPVWFGNVDLKAGARVLASREVGALRFGDRTPVPTTQTDERGRFVLEWVQPGEVELVLDPEPALRGRVVDREGRPLAGWSVLARTSEWLEMSPMHPGSMSNLVGQRRTDAEGRFVLPNADDYPWNLSVAAPDESPFPPRAALEGVRAGDGEVEILVENTATQPCVLVVRLVDADGRPPQDVEAGLRDEHRDAGVFPEYDAATGVATWSVSLPGRYAVQLRRGVRTVHHGDWVELSAGRTTDLGEIVLGVPGEVVVEIDGPEAWGLDHVELELVPLSGIEVLQLERDDLTFHAEAVAPGRYVLRAGHKALFAPESEVEVRAGEVVREVVELVPAFPMRVTFEFPDGESEWHLLEWEVRDAAGSRLRSGHMRNWSQFPGATAAPGIMGLGLPAGSNTLSATTDAGLRAELRLEFADALAARGPHVLAFHP